VTSPPSQMCLNKKKVTGTLRVNGVRRTIIKRKGKKSGGGGNGKKIPDQTPNLGRNLQKAPPDRLQITKGNDQKTGQITGNGNIGPIPKDLGSGQGYLTNNKGGVKVVALYTNNGNGPCSKGVKESHEGCLG